MKKLLSSIANTFSSLFRTEKQDVPTDTVEDDIKNELSKSVPPYAEITVHKENGKYVATIDNCSPENNDVDFDKIGINLLKFSGNGHVKMNWNFDNDITKFYELSEIIKIEKDIHKRLIACEESYKILPAFCRFCIENDGGELPPLINCRDYGPELYMRLGEWEKARRAIFLCMNANAYENKNDGEEMLEYLHTYHAVADTTVSYIAKNPGCLQRNVYKALSFEGDRREALKHFLRHSLQIRKEKDGNTNKLYISSEI